MALTHNPFPPSYLTLPSLLLLYYYILYKCYCIGSALGLRLLAYGLDSINLFVNNIATFGNI